MSDEEETPKSFWTSLPGILTGITGIVSALTALYIAVFGGNRGPASEPARSAVVATTADKSAAAPTQSPAATDMTAKTPPARDTADPFVLAAVIDDPDGFTNVRSSRSASSAVVARVNRNEQFSTYRQDGEWWQVRTRDGTIGYMHASRIRVVQK
jgi:hypothetical protein